MSLEPTQTPSGSGLKTVLDTIVAPKDAFERLRLSPTWGWAAIVALVLLIAGNLLQRPAQLHAAVGTMQHLMATNPIFSNMTDAQKQQAMARASHPNALQTAFAVFGVIASLFVAVLLNTVVLLAGNAAARGNADFRRLWAGSMNVAVPTMGINYLVVGAICAALGPERFASTLDILRVVPGLSMLAPGMTGVAAGFLLGINVFTLWGLGLNVAMMRYVAGVRGAVAWIAPLIVLIGGALISGAAGSFYGG